MFEIILSPCCNFTVTGTAVCDPDNEDKYIITFTLSEPVNMAEAAIAYVLGSDTGVVYPANGATQIVIPNVAGPIGGGLHLYSLNLMMPLGSLISYTPGLSAGVVGYIIPRKPILLPDCNPRPSDMRLKKNIELVGTSKSGIPIYNFDYLTSVGMPGRYQGVMAQDLLGTAHEDAVIPGEHFSVDYAKLDVKFKKLN